MPAMAIRAKAWRQVWCGGVIEQGRLPKVAERLQCEMAGQARTGIPAADEGQRQAIRPGSPQAIAAARGSACPGGSKTPGVPGIKICMSREAPVERSGPLTGIPSGPPHPGRAERHGDRYPPARGRRPARPWSEVSLPLAPGFLRLLPRVSPRRARSRVLSVCAGRRDYLRHPLVVLAWIGRISPGVSPETVQSTNALRMTTHTRLCRRGRPPYFCAEPHVACSDTRPAPEDRAPGRGQALLRALLRDARKQGANLGLTVTTVAAQSPDGRQLSGLCPPCDRFRVHSEHCCDLSRCKQRLGLWGSCRHYAASPPGPCLAILRLLYLWLHSEPALDVPYGLTVTILPSPAVTMRPPGAEVLNVSPLLPLICVTLRDPTDTHRRNGRIRKSHVRLLPATPSRRSW